MYAIPLTAKDIVFTGSNSQPFVYMKLPGTSSTGFAAGQSIRLYNETSIVDSGGDILYLKISDKILISKF